VFEKWNLPWPKEYCQFQTPFGIGLCKHYGYICIVSENMLMVMRLQGPSAPKLDTGSLFEQPYYYYERNVKESRAAYESSNSRHLDLLVEVDFEATDVSLLLGMNHGYGRWQEGRGRVRKQSPSILGFDWANTGILCVLYADGVIKMLGVPDVERGFEMTEYTCSFGDSNQSVKEQLTQKIPCCVAWQQSSTILALGTRKMPSEVSLWRVENGENGLTALSASFLAQFEPLGHEDNVWTSALCWLDEETLITGHTNGRVKVYKVTDGQSEGLCSCKFLHDLTDNVPVYTVQHLTSHRNQVIISQGMLLTWVRDALVPTEGKLSTTMTEPVTGIDWLDDSTVVVLTLDGTMTCLRWSPSKLICVNLIAGSRTQVAPTYVPAIGLVASINKAMVITLFLERDFVANKRNNRLRGAFPKLTTFPIDIPLKDMIESLSRTDPPFLLHDIAWVVTNTDVAQKQMIDILETFSPTDAGPFAQVVFGILVCMISASKKASRERMGHLEYSSLMDICKRVNMDDLTLYQQHAQKRWVIQCLQKASVDHKRIFLAMADLASCMHACKLLDPDEVALVRRVYEKLGTKADQARFDDQLTTGYPRRDANLPPIDYSPHTLGLVVPGRGMRDMLSLQMLETRKVLRCLVCGATTCPHENVQLTFIPPRAYLSCILCALPLVDNASMIPL